MILKKILPFSHYLLEKAICKGDTVLDGTCGNGHDTLLLARLVGGNGHVYAFDIQEKAIQNTRELLLKNHLLKQVSLIQDSHAHVSHHLKTPLRAAIFNLGYLPGGDKSLTTQADSTLASISQVLSLLEKEGLLILVIYHGHPAGKIEKDRLLNYVCQLPQEDFHVLKYHFANQKNDPPILIAVEKRKSYKKLEHNL